MYLDQAYRLSIILSDQPRHKEDAKAYHNKINVLRMKATVTSTRLPDMRRMENEPPETPKRNLLEPIFVGALNDRFTRHNETLAPTEQQSTSKEQSQSDREDLVDSKVPKAATHEIFKQEKDAQAKTETQDDEDPYSSENSTLKDQNEKSSEIQTVVFPNDNLNETTYI